MAEKRTTEQKIASALRVARGVVDALPTDATDTPWDDVARWWASGLISAILAMLNSGRTADEIVLALRGQLSSPAARLELDELAEKLKGKLADETV